MISESAHEQLCSPALARLSMTDHPPASPFDRLARLAARLLRAPVALLVLLTPDREHLLGLHGLGEPWAGRRELPAVAALCRRVVESGAPLALASAPAEGCAAGPEVGAFLAVPLRARNGAAIGALCVIERSPRAWDDVDVVALDDLVAMAETALALRQAEVDHARASQYQLAQRSAFDQIAAGRPLDELLGTLARGIEQQIAGVRCAIMMLDESRLHLSTAAAPSLPPAYSRAIDGVRIGPQAGSCGTAAFLGKPVVVSDIAVDPLWAPWRELALSFGLRACWSIPVIDSAGRTLGTFALYHGEPRRPSEAEFDLVLGAANVVSVAVERWRTLDALRSSEARLRRSEANLAAVFEHANDAIWSVDSDLRVVTINGRAVVKLRVMTGALVSVGATFDQGMPDSQRVFWRGLYRRALAGERFSVEHPYHDGGAQRWCEISLNLIQVDDLIGGVSVFSRDLTDRKRAEAERLAMERSWQETQRLESLGVLAGGIAHDFNNLLATILGNTELALLEAADPSSMRESLEQVELAARRAAEMTRQILAYAGKGQLMVKPISVNEVVRELSVLLRGTLLRQAPISYRLGEGLPPVEGDVAQLNQVVMNLIVNAAEAISGGRGDVVVTTALHAVDADAPGGFEPPPAAGSYVCLEVRDSGPGMSRATRARIFEPFFTTKFTGRGLGLAAVQGIVRSHGGSLRVESAPGLGTTFTVLLPAMGEQQDRGSDGAARSEAQPPAGEPAGLILVIDDEPAVLQITERLLRRLGYAVLDATSHEAALSLLGSYRDQIGCILLDWTMPGRSGDEAFGLLRAQSPQTPIVVMSGYSEHAIIAEITQSEPTGFLHKPFTAELLRRAIVAALGA